MHPHRDQPGTDAVVLLNLGSCDFFFDDNATGKKACNCKAQLTKECWCIGPEGGEGHWAKAVDCEGRYGEGEYKNLLTDRRCAKCARGEQGLQCEQCTSNTLPLRSGDVIAFNGFAAVHGVSRVVPEEPPARKGGPPLPQGAQKKLQEGYRLSVQWRCTW